jgi:ASC-1-like (ASCH) protein
VIHELKILPQYFKEVKEGNKTFELRKNDRGFEVGDTLVLEEYENGHYTGENIKKEISYILADAQFYGLKEGY